MTFEVPETLILSSRDVLDIIHRVGVNRFMDEMIERLPVAFAQFDFERTRIPAREGFQYTKPVTGLIEWMPLYACGESVPMKQVGYHPDNPATRRLPTILSTYNLFDATSGILMAMIDGFLLTAVRTGAASAVATSALSADDSSVLGVIGCGAQAVTQFHGVSRVRHIREVHYFDTDPAAMESFPRRISALCQHELQMTASTPERIAAAADVLCTATSVGAGDGPVFSADHGHLKSPQMTNAYSPAGLDSL